MQNEAPLLSTMTSAKPLRFVTSHLHSELGDWNAYINKIAEPPIGLRSEWSTILAKGLRQEPMYLRAYRGDQLAGVLPLTLVRSFLFGKMLVSSPYLNVGGPIADNRESEMELLNEAVRLADQLNVKHLEVRSDRNLEHPSFNRVRTDKKIMLRSLPKSVEEFSRDIGSNVRNKVKKAQNLKMEVRWGRHELLADFYHVFSVNMRDLGTPVYSKKLFSAVLDELADSAEICVVRHEGRPLAGGLLLFGANRAEIPSASSLRAFNHLNANMLLYYEAFQRAVTRGCRTFDMGRSSEGSGTYKFKEGWGAAPTPCVWQYYDRTKNPTEIRTDTPKMQMRIAVWKKLPVWLTRLVGPTIVRGIP